MPISFHFKYLFVRVHGEFLHYKVLINLSKPTYGEIKRRTYKKKKNRQNWLGHYRPVDLAVEEGYKVLSPKQDLVVLAAGSK